jgi:hypothetical protein
MIFVVLIFFIAIIIAFGMLSYRTWELRTGQVTFNPSDTEAFELSFRKMERTMLYVAKHLIQGFLLVVVKYWLIAITRVRKWLMEKWPKVYGVFKTKEPSPTPIRPSFFTKALMESKTKIKRLKQKIREDHEM